MTSGLSEHFHSCPLSGEEMEAYAAEGNLRLGRVLTDAGLEAMRTECMAAWRAEKGEFDPAKTWLQNALLSDIHHRSAVVRDYYYRGLHKSQGNFSPDRDRRILFLRYADADADEVYNNRRPRLGPLLRGVTRFPEVASYESNFLRDESLPR